MLDVSQFNGFDWDKGNKDKNWIKHKVTNQESEEVFFNTPLLLLADTKHSKSEKRYHALGKTNTHRLLFISFTTRNDLIRIVSARDMSRQERKHYEKAQRNTTI